MGSNFQKITFIVIDLPLFLAIYIPAKVFLVLSPETFAAKPKSVSLILPSSPSKILSDLMSL